MTDPNVLLAAVVNLDRPGRYLHWSIFTVSVANLVLIAVMVGIFGAALLLPFPHREPADAGVEPAPEEAGPPCGSRRKDTPGAGAGRGDDPTMWTARVRRRALSLRRRGMEEGARG